MTGNSGPVAIEVHQVTKRYNIGQQQGARLLSEKLSSNLDAFVRRRSRDDTVDRSFHALEGVSFAVPAGTAMGIIGSNGAGKTTLLKLISRITRPTSGWLRMDGRVGSLLEVGTGFHPELTGRENVYMNGSMLGMRRREITAKFDEIVEFAEVQRFVDTPVRRYSAGMYVRLAFAVAAHLEPEILLLDEVLAVGDVAFQRKCFGKMGEVAASGRTILFVSHNLAAVQQLTTSAVLLESGRLVMQGPTRNVAEVYMAGLARRAGSGTRLVNTRRPMSGLKRQIELVNAELIDDAGGVFLADAPLTFSVEVVARESVPEFRMSIGFLSFEGQPVGVSFSEPLTPPTLGESASYSLRIPDVPLAQGRYHCTLATYRGDTVTGYTLFDVVSEVLAFEVAAVQSSDGTLAYWEPNWGHIRLPTVQVARQ